MTPTALETYKRVKNANWEIATLLESIRVQQGNSADEKELVDSILVLDQAAKTLDSLRKETNRVKERLETLACKRWMEIGTGEPLRTEYCTGSPDVKQAPRIPKEGTEDYQKMCQYFGIPDGAPFRPHWPSMMERVSEEQRSGMALPPGVDPNGVITVFKVTVRKKRPILDDEMIEDETKKEESLF